MSTERDSANLDVAQRFRLVQEQSQELKTLIEQQRFYLMEGSSLNDRLNTKADEMQKSIDDAQDAVQKKIDKDNAIIAELQGQVANGLTPEQAQALLDKMTASRDDIQTTADALAEKATDPTPPADTTGTTDSGTSTDTGTSGEPGRASLR